ncbi:MAG: DUF4446 family protein [Myxococcales bacterium]|nr:MAG: DUF4446 family protein [Myxococcales bacterium]
MGVGARLPLIGDSSCCGHEKHRPTRLISGLVDVFLSVVALLIAIAALAVAVVSLRTNRARRRTSEDDAADLPNDVLGLRQEVAGLRLDVENSLRNLTVVRYDAFGDVGGKLSWSAALLDDHGSGLLLTSIHGRSEARTYAKSISEFSCEQQTSPEEDEVLTLSRKRS